MAPFRDRVLLIAIDDQGNSLPVKVDSLGNLTVSGAGVESGTQIQIVDGTDPLIKAVVTADGSLKVDVSDTEFDIGNFPVEYPLPQAQVDELQSVIATLTNPTADPETGLAKEATLQALAAEDFSSEATLAALKARADLLATEATLGALAGEDFATQATLDALRLLAVELRDNQFRRSDPLVAGENFVGYTNPSRAKDFTDGKFRSASAKVTVPPGLGNMGILQLRNPVGSGVNLLMAEYALAADVNAEVEFWFDTVLTAPTPVNSFMPNRAYEGLVTTVGVAETASAATGGSRVGLGRVQANNTQTRDFTILIPPGKAVGIRVVNPSAVNNLNMYAAATWIEPT